MNHQLKSTHKSSKKIGALKFRSFCICDRGACCLDRLAIIQNMPLSAAQRFIMGFFGTIVLFLSRHFRVDRHEFVDERRRSLLVCGFVTFSFSASLCTVNRNRRLSHHINSNNNLLLLHLHTISLT
jgi:hypothetical protein